MLTRRLLPELDCLYLCMYICSFFNTLCDHFALKKNRQLPQRLHEANATKMFSRDPGEALILCFYPPRFCAWRTSRIFTGHPLV